MTEICQAINSKQLIPTMRSQYMRTAFQIPFDATVRISLDTNLTMVYERDEGVENRDRWYRDPSVQIPGTEITRFPHAVLEVKLQVLYLPPSSTHTSSSTLVGQTQRNRHLGRGVAPRPRPSRGI